MEALLSCIRAIESRSLAVNKKSALTVCSRSDGSDREPAAFIPQAHSGAEALFSSIEIDALNRDDRTSTLSGATANVQPDKPELVLKSA